jgi:predicted DNA-binding protein with PD1-like motif
VTVAHASPLETLTLRLGPGADLRASLEQLVAEQRFAAGCVLCCVGSLDGAMLRLAARDEAGRIDGPLEIVSLVGTLSPDGVHLHVAVADASGVCIGGHQLAGCKVRTTAEIVIGVLPALAFNRRPDEATGYRELAIRQQLRSV